MTPADSIDFARQSIWVLLQISAPAMITALVVGLGIGLLQALTQIQEMTLTFVPKIIIMSVALIFLMPFMLHTMIDFSNELYARIVAIGQSDE